MIKKGVYAAGLSVLNEDRTLNIEATIAHASQAIQSGLHGVFFFGSTGQSQLISINEKKELIAKIASHKLKKQFFLGTGNNSLNENIDLIKYAREYDFKEFLIMPPAYYKGNTDQGVFDFYSALISSIPKIKIILYNFEKLSGYKFSAEAVTKLVKTYPENIIGCKDSSYNLFENLKLSNFLMFPGSEAKLLKGLELGCSGCISAVTNVTHSLARKVFDDYENKKTQSKNEQLINVRETFDQYNLISALHSFLSIKDEKFRNILPPLLLLSQEKQKELLDKLNKLEFVIEKNLAA
ncbi:dihydrodipicolinate synthase family protein [Pelagibacteraceae bacterium]|jgi:4-hydroxy-tetrahydrodipicolinate synthase|nr:dihydrodipicolinate synthase family protein [Pelagibacteraceae bacterium]